MHLRHMIRTDRRARTAALATTLVLLLGACAAPSGGAPSAALLAIEGVTVIDIASGAAPAANQTILIADGVIRAMGPASQIVIPASARRLDARGRFAIPGLWDSHVHFMNTGVTALPVLLAHGVTTVREMGGYIDSTRAWQARMRAGTLVGPRIVTAGPILESPQYLARVVERSQRGDPRLAVRVLPYRIGVGDAATAQRAIDSLRALRVDFVKIRNSGNPTAFYATLRAATAAGLRTVAHQISGVPIASALDSGLTNLEHAMLPPSGRLSTGARDSIDAAFARNRAWFTPTLSVSSTLTLSGDSASRAIFDDAAIRLDERRAYASAWLLEWWRMQVDERAADTSSTREARALESYRSSAADVRRLRSLGVEILAGTDAGSVLVYPGFSLHEELEMLVTDAKLTPREALESATLSPARFARLDARLGTITAGKIADIIILDADPLADIRNTRRIHAVVQDGRVFTRADLDALLTEVRATVAREGLPNRSPSSGPR